MARDRAVAGTAATVAARFAPIVVRGARERTSARAAAEMTEGCENADTRTTALSLKTLRATFACLINAERSAAGIANVAAGASLQRGAVGFSREMVRKRFFGHFSPTGSTLVTRVQRTGYLRRARAWALGETLAYGTGRVSTRELVDALLASPSHRAVFRDGRYRQVGVGLRRGVPTGRGAGLTVTLDFGVRR